MLNVYNQIDTDIQTAYLLSAVFAHRKPAVTTVLCNHISRMGNNIAMFIERCYIDCNIVLCACMTFNIGIMFS